MYKNLRSSALYEEPKTAYLSGLGSTPYSNNTPWRRS
jgi:hypothetical protein